MLVPWVNYAALLTYCALIILINAGIAGGLFLLAGYFAAGNLAILVTAFLIYILILLLLNKIFNLNTELGQLIQHAGQRFF